MSDRAVLLIVAADRLLLIHRRKAGQDYYVLPGGGVERGETPEAAAVREALEEAGLSIVLGDKVAALQNGDRVEHYFRVASFTGEPILGGPERERQASDNEYHLVWIAPDQLDGLTLRPEAARALCRDALRLLH
jgi:8-oxo-dGTP diphosphatase